MRTQLSNLLLNTRILKQNFSLIRKPGLLVQPTTDSPFRQFIAFFEKTLPVHEEIIDSRTSIRSLTMEHPSKNGRETESRLPKCHPLSTSESPVKVLPSSGSLSSSIRVSIVLLLVFALYAHQVSCTPGASIDESSEPGSSLTELIGLERREAKRGTPCRRGTIAEIEKWDRCERCARATRSRDNFSLCCSNRGAEEHCKDFLSHRPDEFNKRPRSRRTPANFNRLVRSVLTRKFHPMTM